MRGKLCLVTGANSGHGRAVASAFAKMGATVILGCRNAESAETARSDIVRETGNVCIHVLPIDLASQESVREAADRFLMKHRALDVLVNNAGAWWAERRISPDGIEMVWATNVIGPFQLTRLLLPALLARGAGRIVNVASSYASGLDLEDVEFQRRPYSGIHAYQASKQAVRMLTWSMADQLTGKPIVANAVCPGFMTTGLGRNAAPGFRFFLALTRPFQSPPERGADTTVWLASSSEAAGISNQFLVKRRPVPCQFRDADACARLVRLCEKLLSR
jgi:NAD(P)-dependent dehydrogenase (short-subunit alcohol dehydrogenase family)